MINRWIKIIDTWDIHKDTIQCITNREKSPIGNLRYKTSYTVAGNKKNAEQKTLCDTQLEYPGSQTKQTKHFRYQKYWVYVSMIRILIKNEALSL